MVTIIFLVAFCFFAMLAPWQAQASGFQRIRITSADGSTLEAGVWYPNTSSPKTQNNPFDAPLARNAPIEGKDLPLVVFSHGYGGWLGSHHDTALALSRHGYVVVAPTHNTDTDPALQGIKAFLKRPEQISQTLDYMLNTWPDKGHIDSTRVGIFGFSAGGFTALVAAGGVPDLQAIAPFCHEHPDEFLCEFQLEQTVSELTATGMPINWKHDPRIKAAVISSPALGFTFSHEGLTNVQIPVQLWYTLKDTLVPYATNIRHVQQLLPQPAEVCAAPEAGHFIFMPPCKEEMKETMPDVWNRICIDPPGVDRTAFHNRFNNAIREFFTRTL